MKVTKGSCLCGNITYLIEGPLRSVSACHCNQCRKSTGHYVASTQCMTSDLNINGDSLVWFKSSLTAERGFCSTCGSNLFWSEFESNKTSIWAGTIDGPTGLKMTNQIHSESKGDYYELPDIPTIEQTQLR
ncbi:MAG: GFA family protein [Hellea sp.]